MSLDAYTLRARVVPVLVVVVPPFVLLGVGVVLGTRLGITTGLVVTVLAAIAGQLGRDRGRALQPGLWAEWGGSPALRRLRFATGGSAGRVERLHARIERLVGHALPDRASEERDRGAADEAYDEAIQWLIGATRDKDRFSLLFAENVNYGQRRNLLGLRSIGKTVAVATLVLAVLLTAVTSGSFSSHAVRYGPGALVAAAALGFWGEVVTRDWVRVPAEAYADRLVEAAGVLERDGR